MNTTDEVEAVTHMALEESGGSITIAAAKLGLTPIQLTNRISNNKNLKSRWRRGKIAPKPPGEDVTIHRAPIITEAEESPLKSELAVAEALKRQDRDIREGLEGMGLSQAGLNLSIVCQQFHRKHFRSALEGMSGGIYRQFMRIMEMVDDIDEQLSDMKDPPLSLPEKAMLREDRRGLMIIMGQYKDKVDKSVLIQAQVSKITREREDKSKSYKPKGVLDLESANT